MSFANLFASSLQTLANIHGKDDGTLHSTLEPNIVKYQSDYQILISEIVW